MVLPLHSEPPAGQQSAGRGVFFAGLVRYQAPHADRHRLLPQTKFIGSIAEGFLALGFARGE
jgi:hypothetical protein